MQGRQLEDDSRLLLLLLKYGIFIEILPTREKINLKFFLITFLLSLVIGEVWLRNEHFSDIGWIIR
jgi:hypothetical protein